MKKISFMFLVIGLCLFMTGCGNESKENEVSFTPLKEAEFTQSENFCLNHGSAGEFTTIDEKCEALNKDDIVSEDTGESGFVGRYENLGGGTFVDLTETANSENPVDADEANIVG